MALVKKQSNSSRLIIMAVAVLVVGVIGFVLYQQVVLKTNTPGKTSSTAPRHPSIITNFGESIVSDPRYLELKPYGQPLSVNAETDGGQTNPFR